MATTCPKCLFENPEGAEYCAKCGTRIQGTHTGIRGHVPNSPEFGTCPRNSVTKTLETTPEGLGKGELFAGRFELIEELGAGGMGIVYRAYDKEVGEEIALKVLHPDIALDQKTVDRFRNEIKLARRITHKNVCRMHELHQDGKELFITMEYVSGLDLKGLIRELGALSAGHAISIAKQVCEGLAEAHDLGVIHRDLKPQNIMVDKEGNAKIMDFGIARSLRTAGMTSEGMIIGTPEYMAPEQVEGLEADQRTDIYALGAIIFEMVTGRVPFEGNSPLSVAYKHKNEPPIPPRKLNTEIPEPLNGLILRCLEKEKDKRYQTADEVLADLIRVEDGLPISERVVLKARPTIHITREKPTGVRRVLVQALALLVIVLGGAVIWQFLIKKDARGPANMENSIAVISFENQTGDKALDKYREIIPNLLITNLEQAQSFYVMSAERQRDLLTQVGKGGGDIIDSDAAFEVCRKEGVKSLATGSFYRSGEILITDVKVLDVRTKRLLNTAKAQGTGLDSVFNQVDELSRKIASGLGVAKEKLDASLKPVGEIGTKSTEAYQYYIQGIEDNLNWRYTRAREALEKAVEIDPEFADAHFQLAAAYGGESDLPARKQALRMAHLLSKNATEKQRFLIEAYYAYDTQDFNKELAIYQEFVAKYPKEKLAHAQLGLVYQDSDPEKAISEYNIALSLDPNYKMALNNLGYVYAKRKEFTKALEYFQRQISIPPERPNSYDSLAECYFRAGMIAQAKDTYKKSFEKWPNETKADSLQYIYALEEDYAEALRLWDRKLELCAPPQKRMVYWQRGFYRGWVGDAGNALSDLQRAEEMSGAMGERSAVALIQWLRSWLYLDQHRLELSRKSLEDLRSFYSENLSKFADLYDARYNDLLGRIECEEGNADSAELRRKEMQALVPRLSGNNQEALRYAAGLLQAEVALSGGAVDEAIGFIEKMPPQPLPYSSAVFFPSYNIPFYRDVLARAYAKKGVLDKAIGEYVRLTTFDPKKDAQFLVHPKYHYRLGLLYEQKGLRAKAAERYRKFLDLWKAADPKLPEVADATKRLAALS